MALLLRFATEIWGFVTVTRGTGSWPERDAEIQFKINGLQGGEGRIKKNRDKELDRGKQE